MRVELRVPLHALLHVPELLYALGALYLLFAIVEAGKRLFELGATWTTGHAPQARTVPVDVSIWQDQA